MNSFIYWAKCPICGNVLCKLLWYKTKFEDGMVRTFSSKYECRLGHKFKIKVYEKEKELQK